MSQTSNERLRDYLVQLPPQSQALLMREFERAIERGDDTTVATIALEQLRKIVRGADEEARPRTDDPARLLFRPLEAFLVESNVPVRPGQIRRSSLLPVWQWLNRDGAPEQAREFDATLARMRETGSSQDLEVAVRKLQRAAADAIFKITAPGSDKQRALARVGHPEVIEDLLPIGSVLHAREALDTLKVPAPQVHLEVFKSLDSDPFAAVKIEDDGDEPPATAVVELDGQTHTVSWPRKAKLLDVLLDAGLDAPFSCREGHCGACATTLRKGKVSMEVNDVLEQQDLDDGLILACQSHPDTDSVEVTYDE